MTAIWRAPAFAPPVSAEALRERVELDRETAVIGFGVLVAAKLEERGAGRGMARRGSRKENSRRGKLARLESTSALLSPRGARTRSGADFRRVGPRAC
ncbi:MAG: hypothetical protein CBD18_08300 [Opitutales bacterium TMED158]|nr:MAG: hypothetical protein CBD18_08300 [Opitutales bacterium TMED158]